MPGAESDLPTRLGLPLMVAAAALLYIAARASLDALLREGELSPGRHAFAHWIPIALTALLALALGQPEIAVGVVFATSVASLTLVLGVVTYLSPLPPGAVTSQRRLWPFVLPAALLALLAGFSGGLTLRHALFLGVLGLILLALWSDQARRARQTPMLFGDLYAPPYRLRPLQYAELALAIAVAGLGAWAAVRGAVHLAGDVPRFSTGLIAATVIGPLLAIPMIGPGTILSHRGHWETATTAAIGIVLLNLCFLLPLVILLWHGIAEPSLPRLLAAATGEIQTAPLVFPLSIWRLDTVILIVLGFMLLPIALGHWTLGRIEGMALIVAYGIYLILNADLGVR